MMLGLIGWVFLAATVACYLGYAVYYGASAVRWLQEGGLDTTEPQVKTKAEPQVKTHNDNNTDVVSRQE